MSRFMVRLLADSLVRLSEKPYIEGERKSFTLNLPGMLTISVFDHVISVGGVDVPRGLVINALIDAEDFNTAIIHAQDAAVYFLSMLSCVCNASVFRPRPLWGYDATPGVTDREYKIFAYDFHIHLYLTRP